MDMNYHNLADAPLAILPGLMCDGSMFADQLRSFTRAKVIGGFYGGADRIEAMADYVLEHMPVRASLLGHSMGARVALEVYRKAPDRVVGLALADTGFHPPRMGERDARYALRDIGRARGFEALVDTWLPPMLGPTNRDDRTLLASLKAMCMSAGQAVFEAQIEALLHRPDTQSVISACNCPVMLLVGSEDEWSTPQQHVEMARQLGNAPLAILDGAGHMAPCERPAAFNEALARWLNGQAR